MFFGAEWWAHYVAGRKVEIRVVIDAIVYRQMACQHFAKYTLAFAARASNGFERVDA